MSDQVLSASGEAAWQALRQHIEWEHGFWVGWAFTDHTPSVHELHRRAEALLRGVGRGTVLRQPREPSELVDVLLWLNAGADGCDGCVMVAVVNSGEAWRDAWDQLMLRLNERRELLRESLRGGLLLFAPTSFKARSREAAPDLWSIRSLVLDVAPVAREVAEETLQLSVLAQETMVGSDTEVTLALQAVAAGRRAGQLEAEVDARIRAAVALFGVGRRDEGREQAASAVEQAPSPGARARALVVLADIERELGDLVAAESHYHAAIAVNSEAVGVGAYLHLSAILRQRHARVWALAVAEAGLAKSSTRRKWLGATPDVLRDEAMSWRYVGNMRRALGDLSGAGVALAASLELSHRRRERVGDTAGALRHESLVMRDVGDVNSATGNLSGAGEAYDASLALSRKIKEIVGDTAEVLRDEAQCLGRIGDWKMTHGDLSGAQEAYYDSLRLSRRVRLRVGETADTLYDEGLILMKIGDLKAAQGDFSWAGETFEASLDLCRQIRGMTGDTASALTGEAAAWQGLGKVRKALDDWDGAGSAYQECLGLLRHIRKIVGDTVDILKIIASTLRSCSVVYRHLGNLGLARDALVEAAELLRGLEVHGGRSSRNEDSFTTVLELLEEVEAEIAGGRVPGDME